MGKNILQFSHSIQASTISEDDEAYSFTYICVYLEIEYLVEFVLFS